MANEPPITMHRETLTIEGGRNLYNYTFNESTAQERLLQMIEGKEQGVIGPFLDRHPKGLDLAAALEVATDVGNAEAVELLKAH